MQETEILAPAGSPEALAAALDAGADAVYFGLKKLNARQGAANFLPSRLEETIRMIHSRGGKAYLTLNIDLCQRDLGEAARTLELASRCGVDAVLIKDPALLAMKSFFPSLSFHFSTQAGISASPGVAAAHCLGVSRVVLARELSRDEIISCCRISGMEIEVFVQGAMCFSCSGRCLLSSWIGGRSGNRGACASPCRFLWRSVGAESASRPFSMHDLCLLNHVSELREAGVCSLKIEGRLKSPRWVHDAVHLYREALSGSTAAEKLLSRARTLGNYTGRQLTDSYYRGCRNGLTGESARPASAGEASSGAPAAPPPSPGQRPSPVIQGDIAADDRDGLIVTWRNGEKTSRLRIPPQRIANSRRALKLKDIFQRLSPQSDKYSLSFQIPESLQERLLPKRHCSQLEEDLNHFVRDLEREEDGNVRLSLEGALRRLVSPRPVSSSENHLGPGAGIQYIRLSLKECDLIGRTAGECKVIFCWHPESGKSRDRQLSWIQQNRSRIFAVALPQVCYEEELPLWDEILECCRHSHLTVEINSWEGWELTRQKGLPMIGGSGMAVLNSLAADYLKGLGCGIVTVSPEIDREQLEDLCAHAEVPLLLTVFSRPVLFQTRVQDAVPLNQPVEDNKKIRMLPRREGSLTMYRPETPMDWRSVRNPGIRVWGLEMDFRGSRNPEYDWQNPAPLKSAFLFNYDRQLR